MKTRTPRAKVEPMKKMAPEFSSSAIAPERVGDGPLYRRIRIAIERWVESRGEGTRLPSERELARQFDVERNTLRQALQPLVDEGVLVKSLGRTGGIFVGRQRGSDQGHPFMLQDRPPISSTPAVRMVVFENWPVQKAVWTRLMQQFNELHPSAPLELIWLPAEVDNLNRYRLFIREEQPDLVMLSCDFARAMREEGLLMPLPADLSLALQGEDFHSNIFGTLAKDVLMHVLPLHFNFYGVLWNETLVPCPGPSWPTRLTQQDLVQWVCDVAPGLPASSRLCADTFFFVSIMGVPEVLPTEDSLVAYLRESFSMMEKLSRWKDKLVWRGPMTAQVGRRFLDNKSAFFAGNMIFVLQDMIAARAPWNGAFLVPPPGRRLGTAFNCAAMPAGIRNPDRAGEVLRFLASAAAQDEIAKAGMNAAFRKSSNRHLLSHMRASRQDDLDAALGSVAVLPDRGFMIGSFMFYELRTLHQEVMEGRRSAEEATVLAQGMALSNRQDHNGGTAAGRRYT